MTTNCGAGRSPGIHLVSGATSGIGHAIFQLLVDQGEQVVPVVRSASQAEALGVTEWLQADFECLAESRAAFRAFDRPIDSFINCAGIAVGKPIWDNDDDEIQRLLNINLISPMVACGELRGKIKKGGAIVLFSSQSAFRGGWDDVYIASKGGINSLVKSLAQKMAPDVRVIGVAPGVTADTRMTRERKQDDLSAVVQQVPLRRLAQPQEIAALVLSLLGPAGAHMTGSMIDVNGGAYLR